MERNIRWGKGARVHDKDVGRDALLEAAIRCIARDGIKPTTMQSVAAEAHVSRRTVYRYFHSRTDLLHEVKTHLENRIFHGIEQRADQYTHNFYAYLEEAIILGVNGLKMLEHFTDSTITNEPGTANKAGRKASKNKQFDAQLRNWTALLRKPYRNELAKGKANLAPLETYAELAVLLVNGHHQLQSEEKDIRKSFQTMRFLSQRYNRRSLQGRYSVALGESSIDNTKAKPVKTLFLS